MSDLTINCGFGCSSVEGCQGHCENPALLPKDDYLSKTRLYEEVPGVPEDEKFGIWCGQQRRRIWEGSSKAAGEKWAAENNITIDLFEPFEP